MKIEIVIQGLLDDFVIAMVFAFGPKGLAPNLGILHIARSQNSGDAVRDRNGGASLHGMDSPNRRERKIAYLAGNGEPLKPGGIPAISPERALFSIDILYL